MRARVFCPLFCHWPRVKTTRSPCLSRPSGRVTSETRACIFPALLCVAEMRHHSQSTGWQVSRPYHSATLALKFETINNQWFLWPTLPWWPVTCSRELTWLENESSSRYCFRQGLKYPVNKRNRNTDSWIKSEPCHTTNVIPVTQTLHRCGRTKKKKDYKERKKILTNKTIDDIASKLAQFQPSASKDQFLGKKSWILKFLSQTCL